VAYEDLKLLGAETNLGPVFRVTGRHFLNNLFSPNEAKRELAGYNNS
jgi:hypothetical protein